MRDCRLTFWALCLSLASACGTEHRNPSDAGTKTDGRTPNSSSWDASTHSRLDSGSTNPRDASMRVDKLDAAVDASSMGTSTLSEQYPGDMGLSGDPTIIWMEDFEEGSLANIASRYDQVQGQDRWLLVSDTPNNQGSALALRAGQGQDAVDLYKQLPNADEWYVRWYAKYEAGVPWHHSGVWFGGYNPAMAWPSPMAGLRPNGGDRFSFSIEPVYDVSSAAPRFDFYNYWMTMHSWMADPIVDDGTAYYGNGLVHRNNFTVDPENWVCLEVHVRLNTDVASSAGAIVEVWKNDTRMQRFDDAAPLGYWIRDKFCPSGADGAECTDYPAAANEVLDLQMRNDANLQLNAFWPQNYITADAMGTLTLDQMVVAARRIGCMQ